MVWIKINLPANPRINGFLFAFYFLSEELKNRLYQVLECSSGYDNLRWCLSPVCSDENRAKFDAIREEILREYLVLIPACYNNYARLCMRKEPIMLQQVKVTSAGPAAIKPLLEAAIRSQMRSLEHGIQRTQERLAEFEQRFNMTSAEFERGFENGQIEETLDYIEWSGEIKTLRLLEDQIRALQSAKVR